MEFINRIFHWGEELEQQQQQQQQVDDDDDVDQCQHLPILTETSFTTNHLIYSGIILLMAAYIVYSYIERKRLKRIMRKNQRKLSDMIPDPLREMAEFAFPMKKQRFRKRDKFYFQTRKMLRNVEQMSRNRKKIIENMFQHRISPPEDDESGEIRDARILCDLGPAEIYLDEDEEESESDPELLPEELKVLLNSFNLFGQFDEGVFVELCQRLDTLNVPAGQYLFRVGKYSKVSI